MSDRWSSIVADDCAPCGHAWTSHVHGAGCTVPACGCNRWKAEQEALTHLTGRLADLQQEINDAPSPARMATT